MKSILLIDHGSRLAEANHMLACMAELVQEMAGAGVVVRYAHMELAEPSIAQGFANCVAAGADEVIAFPYMLSPGRHSTRDIPRMIGEAATAHPGVAYHVTQAFGMHEMLAAVVLSRAGVRPVRGADYTGGSACRDPQNHPGRCGEACPALRDREAFETPLVISGPGSSSE